jgi:glycosyltransferase involved in cell wall biosynthesis
MTENCKIELDGPIIYFGVYDKSKPRNRLMVKALEAGDVDIVQIHIDIWSKNNDKSQMKLLGWLVVFLKMLIAYPVLIYRYIRAPRHQLVVVAYPGLIDVILLRPFARLRRARIVYDVFISAYDTIVSDRKLLRRNSLFARIIYRMERIALRMADLVIMDTQRHADFIRRLYKLPNGQVGAVLVGAEADNFKYVARPSRAKLDPIKVLFYGQLIPLHGVKTILDAAKLAYLRGESIEWHIVGKGQVEKDVELFLADNPNLNLHWDKWVSYHTLSDLMESADIGLGIFGTSGKSARVIPNKVFQMLSVGLPVVTRDSLAMRELVNPNQEKALGVSMVETANADALLNAVKDLAASGAVPPEELAESFSDKTRGVVFLRLLTNILNKKATVS